MTIAIGVLIAIICICNLTKEENCECHHSMKQQKEKDKIVNTIHPVDKEKKND